MSLTFELSQSLHQWLVVAAVLATMVVLAMERKPIELTALAVLVFLLLFYSFFPVLGPEGNNLLGPGRLLSGFANPSLIAVLCLLVIGQAMIQTDALTPITNMLLRLSSIHPLLTIAVALLGVLLISAALNNTPIVVMFIPVMQSMAQRLDWPASRIMMPLSYAAILGGSVTLIGSSTNLLVSSTMVQLGEAPIGFFDFTVPGLILGAVGLVYVLVILPRLLPERASMAMEWLGEGKQFIAEINATEDSPLVGQKAVGGVFPKMPDMTVRLVQRGGMVILPPFENYTIRAGDVLIVAATRHALTELLSRTKGFFVSEETPGRITPAPETAKTTGPEGEEAPEPAEHMLTELMVAPASRLIDRSLDQVAFTRRYNCRVLGIQRRARMVRGRVGDIRLQAGDILLVVGKAENVRRLRNDSDLIRLAWSTREMPRPERAPHAAAIFLGTVLLAAVGVLPISVAAPAGAALMLFSGCLNIRQAVRALDRKIVLLVAASLALSAAMDETGAARMVAMELLDLIPEPSPMVTSALLFLIVAVATNMLSNNACAVLFTPVAVGLAPELGIAPQLMGITVILAANCSFASPIGYQTNLLVMGPGHYRFRDFLRGGAPLILILWITYCLIFPWWYDI